MAEAQRPFRVELWPDLSSPARAIGGGENDAAVVVGVEGYFVVPGVPGAKSNAKAWHQYLTETREVPPQNIKLLINENATRERILEGARKAASRAGKDGTLWFVFVGHGAPSVDGKDGLLVGVDAQQEAQSLQERSVRRNELLKVLGTSQARVIPVVIDACFSGRGQDGVTIAPGIQPLLTVTSPGATDPRIVVLTAAQGNQFAGPLPGARRPAFSYLVLGGLRGWAATNKDVQVTAGGLLRYAQNVLEATLRGRDQSPDLIGAEGMVIGRSSGEKGPNLARLASATAGADRGNRGVAVQAEQIPAPQVLPATPANSVTEHAPLPQVLSTTPAIRLSEAKAFPNPLDTKLGQTSMTFAPLPVKVQVRIYDLTGVLIKDMFSESAGTVSWDVTDQNGKQVAGGVYLALIQSDSEKRTIKVAIRH
jgi:hypothetical protein